GLPTEGSVCTLQRGASVHSFNSMKWGRAAMVVEDVFSLFSFSTEDQMISTGSNWTSSSGGATGLPLVTGSTD
ncbi:hypothetical protein DKP78_20465, partial [Enterococcus faecium]